MKKTLFPILMAFSFCMAVVFSVIAEVTHEQIEALTMSDQIGVMHDGVIVQEGSPTEIYNHPNQVFCSSLETILCPMST